MPDHSISEMILLRDRRAGVYFDGVPVEACALNTTGKVFIVEEAEVWLGADYEVKYRVSLISYPQSTKQK